MSPDLDTKSFAIVGRISRANHLMDQSFNGLVEEFGLTRAAWDVLASLREAGPPFELSPTELYRVLLRTSGAMTHRLKRLEAARLIERRPDPEDKRGLLVRLTKRGQELVDELAPLNMAAEREMLATLDTEERAVLERILRRLLNRLETPAP